MNDLPSVYLCAVDTDEPTDDRRYIALAMLVSDIPESLPTCYGHGSPIARKSWGLAHLMKSPNNDPKQGYEQRQENHQTANGVLIYSHTVTTIAIFSHG
ncbi:MAG: hypothetical protein JW384_01598 [Nitrosomonadaceae bacterium]|nr:hypothetical protein [Nitrosomonadaceae bacterium]